MKKIIGFVLKHKDTFILLTMLIAFTAVMISCFRIFDSKLDDIEKYQTESANILEEQEKRIDELNSEIDASISEIGSKLDSALERNNEILDKLDELNSYFSNQKVVISADNYDALLQNLYAPKNFYLTPDYYDGKCYRILYGHSYTNDVISLMLAHDEYGSLYQVTTEVSYQLNDKEERFSYGFDSLLTSTSYPARGLQSELFYMLVDSYSLTDDEYNYLKDSYIIEEDGDYRDVYLDVANNQFSAKARYMITDTRSGKVYYSGWTNIAKCGRDVESNPLPESLAAPKCKIDGLRYYTDSDCKTALLNLNVSKDEAIDVINAKTGSNVYIEVFVNGNRVCFDKINNIRYDGTCECYLGNISIDEAYELESVKVRYSIYSTNDKAVSENPDITSEWVELLND